MAEDQKAKGAKKSSLEDIVSKTSNFMARVGKTVIGAAFLAVSKAFELGYHIFAGIVPRYMDYMDKVKKADDQKPEDKREYYWYNPRKSYTYGGIAKTALAGYAVLKAPAIAGGIAWLASKYFGLGIAAAPLIPFIKIPLLVYAGYKLVDLFLTTRVYSIAKELVKKAGLFRGADYQWTKGTPGFFSGINDYFKSVGDMYKSAAPSSATAAQPAAKSA